MTVSTQEMKFFCNYLREKSAIVLDASKEYLVTARLTPLARTEGYDDANQLIAALRDRPTPDLSERVVDAMTTNETSFFRNVRPFTALRDHILPYLKETRSEQRSLKIWCGAASSGQEPYSLAMVLKDFFDDSWKIEFIATDISALMLDRARSGLYSQLEVNRGLPAKMLLRYFTQVGKSWQISDSLRTMIRFRKLNLIEPWPLLPRFDLVMMRNVLIYFDDDIKRDILADIRRRMAPDGYLILGSAESPLGLDESYVRESMSKTIVYRLQQ